MQPASPGQAELHPVHVGAVLPPLCSCDSAAWTSNCFMNALSASTTSLPSRSSSAPAASATCASSTAMGEGADVIGKQHMGGSLSMRGSCTGHWHFSNPEGGIHKSKGRQGPDLMQRRPCEAGAHFQAPPKRTRQVCASSVPAAGTRLFARAGGGCRRKWCERRCGERTQPSLVQGGHDGRQLQRAPGAAVRRSVYVPAAGTASSQALQAPAASLAWQHSAGTLAGDAGEARCAGQRARQRSHAHVRRQLCQLLPNLNRCQQRLHAVKKVAASHLTTLAANVY